MSSSNDKVFFGQPRGVWLFAGLGFAALVLGALPAVRRSRMHWTRLVRLLDFASSLVKSAYGSEASP
ncbi:MAG: hypothetical protein IPM54_19585 [Polyangiaceae bacterium]|nr:hypothetical protein [Polyangiaceae bacterium]